MKRKFISIDISCLGFREALEECRRLSIYRTPSYVCFSNVHMVVEAWDKNAVREAVRGARFAFPDGMPVAKGIALGYSISQERIAGMDFIGPFLEILSQENLNLCIIGGGDETQAEARKQIPTLFPGINRLDFVSPPFRNWSDEETEGFARQILESEPHAVFVILGCPRQELFMARVSHQIPALMLGLGGALPTFLGIHRRAPNWMRRLMLEWLYRLIQEPGRLWRRYTYTNLKFMVLYLWFLFFGPKTRTS